MAAKTFEFDEDENPAQLHFFECQLPIAGFTGGYGNGKTAVLGLEAITIASQYEGARVLVGRASRPKLEDSTKPELLKWLPEDWVAQWPSERKNNVKLKHTGSTIEFRHIRQEGKGKGEEQGNLLSATYDAILVDQFDDPEFSYKDFEDLIGRLRGTARYIGDDPKMPTFGPQFFRFTANPTRNWLYREVVNPFFLYKRAGIVNEKLFVHPDTKKCIVAIFNAPTSANSRHTGKEYAKRMGIIFRGAMKKRFIDGDWGAYEGLIYPDYDPIIHIVRHDELQEHIAKKLIRGEVGILEGYDYGQAVPSCYLLAFVDDLGNVFIVDGFYHAQKTIKWQAEEIKRIRDKWKVIPRDHVFADPSIFKTHASKDKIGETVAQLFAEEHIDMQRGASSINSGIQKVSSYLQVDEMHKHPITGNIGAPRLFISSGLEFLDNEFSDYYWNKNTIGQNVDKPRDVNDHAMDTVKYLLTRRARVVGMVRAAFVSINPAVFQWHERPDGPSQGLAPRHM